MASLIEDIADHIAANDVTLIVDTNLFIGHDVYNAPDPSVVVQKIPGSSENFSGLIEDPFQIVVKNKSYIDAQSKAESIYALFKHKTGFASGYLAGDGIFYVEPTSRPFPLDRDDKGSFIFVVNFIIRRE